MKILAAALLLLSFAGISRAQAVPAGKDNSLNAQYFGEVQLGLDQGLGYTIPTVEFIAGVEKPINHRFEIDGYGEYGITHKAFQSTGANGYTVVASGTPILWAKWFGITGKTSFNHLGTHDYSKNGVFFTPGVVFRAKPLSLPSRLYLNTLIPNYGIDRKTGIEANKEIGFQFTWESRFGHFGPVDVHWLFNVNVYHGYNQGNPQCDGTDPGPVTCPRSSWLTYTTEDGITFVFGANKDTNALW